MLTFKVANLDNKDHGNWIPFKIPNYVINNVHCRVKDKKDGSHKKKKGSVFDVGENVVELKLASSEQYMAYLGEMIDLDNPNFFQEYQKLMRVSISSILSYSRFS